MGITIFRPGRRIVIPSPGVQVWTPRVASASTWWNNNGAISGCVAAYQPKGAASLATSYVNLANPGTYDAATGVAPTWNITNGWIFNGSSQWLTLGVVPAAGYGIIFRFSDWAATDNMYFGSITGGSARIILSARVLGTSRQYHYGSTTLNVGTTTSSGVVGLVAGQGYFNGSAEGALQSWSGTATRAIYIGALNNEGTASNFANCYIQALAIYSTTLTAGEVATITSAMQAL